MSVKKIALSSLCSLWLIVFVPFVAAQNDRIDDAAAACVAAGEAGR